MGVAGGDAASTTTANTGVQLINMKIYEPTGGGYASTSVFMNAYYEGASGTNVFNGKGLHIISQSNGRKHIAFDSATAQGINYINRNGVAFVVSRGNRKTSETTLFSLDIPSVPATMKPGKVMCVGASGTNGHYHKLNTNGNHFSSLIYKNVDFLAPGADSNIVTTKSNYDPMTTSLPVVPSYMPFSGTSASAPHVAGVTALMMSYRNQPTNNWDNIVHEDCEAMLKRTATDLIDGTGTYTETLGPDSVSGHGRINAGAALAALEPQYRIHHIDATHNITSVSISTINTTSHAFDWFPIPTSTVVTGGYNVTRLKVTTVYNYSFPGETFIDAWPLYMVSKGCPIVSPQSPPILQFKTDELSYVELDSATISSATLTTYVYRLNYSIYNPSVTIQNTYIPWQLNEINSAFSLYTLGPPVSVKEGDALVDYFNLYPNPTNGDITLGFDSKSETKGTIAVFDLMGREVFKKEGQIVKYGVNRINLSLANLPAGIYLLNLDIESNKTMVKKLIIN